MCFKHIHDTTRQGAPGWHGLPLQEHLTLQDITTKLTVPSSTQQH